MHLIMGNTNHTNLPMIRNACSQDIIVDFAAYPEGHRPPSMKTDDEVVEDEVEVKSDVQEASDDDGTPFLPIYHISSSSSFDQEHPPLLPLPQSNNSHFIIDVPPPTTTTTTTVHDTVVKSVVEKFEQRSRLGMQKYGTTLDRTDLSTLEWTNHLQEELMDAILYLERLKRDIQQQTAANCV